MTQVRRPKTKCCVSRDRCSRCPLRLLKEGTLPDGFAVRRRVLVRQPEPEDPKARKSKITKAELDLAILRTKKRLKAAKQKSATRKAA